MISDIINMNKLPEHVFNKHFEKFRYVVFSETNHNQIDEFMLILCGLLKDTKSKKLFSFEIKESKFFLIKEFDLFLFNPAAIANFFKNYEDENGVSYFLYVASNIVFFDEKQTICVYSDREFDVSIIGCSESVYKKLPAMQVGLTFMTLNEYLIYIKRWIKKEMFDEIAKKLKLNYSR